MGRRDEDRDSDPSARPNWAEKTNVLIGVVTVLVAIVGIGIGVILTSSSSSSQPPVAKPAHLDLVDLTVRDAGGQPRRHAAVDITLHNLGGRLAVIDGAMLKIERTYQLKRCASQDDLPINHVYGVVLPVDAEPGTTVDTALHQEVGPDEADRFGIDVSASSAPPEGAIDIFEFDLSLRHDGARAPQSLGKAQVSLPNPAQEGEYYWTARTAKLLRRWAGYEPSTISLWDEALPCWRSNTVDLRRALGSSAARSPQLDALADTLIWPTPVWRE